jgi:hypothetical protein
MREIGEHDNARFEARRKQLGKKGLADLKKIIDSAINQNDVNKNWGKYFEGISFFKRKKNLRDKIFLPKKSLKIFFSLILKNLIKI